ncbi:MAG: methionine gamma-lyase [Rhodocyclaceae bacterium]|nr:methionine gamma-lyase [Rhodocyclaceae bacterium]MBK6555607.1 methionine gamma-lyase [Rhodocyclaceae bacterium]MBK9312542.1 methionine gamma-lyase [Rhodocyclaceae bacterium]MBK9955804.1 methionine gamma-lyase [Rhodocyclaceae bacterium]
MDTSRTRRPGFDTRAIHHGYDPYAGHGSLNPPVYLSSTYAFPTVEDGSARFAGEQAGFVYSRVGNPTTALLEARVADLEGGEAALATASGQGATTSLLWTLLAPGDEIIADKTLYGCTFGFLNHGLAKFGVKVTHVDLTNPANLEAAIGPTTRVVFFESPANPNMRLVDIAAVTAIARRHGARTVVDNTYCTPYLQRPLELGADFVLHSATKYLGGHGDLLAGVIVGDKETLDKVRFYGLKDMTGAVLSSQDAFLVLRGLKTLSLRMDRHCTNARAVAEFLAGHGKIAVVHYPGLASFPQLELARRQMAQPGGMIAFELKDGIEAGRRFMNALRVFTRAVSLGDAESLAQHPASMTHAFYTPEERVEHLISEGLVRLSIGLEDIADLLGDLEQALAVA